MVSKRWRRRFSGTAPESAVRWIWPDSPNPCRGPSGPWRAGGSLGRLLVGHELGSIVDGTAAVRVKGTELELVDRAAEPSGLALAQNYPNPVTAGRNAKTTVRFHVPTGTNANSTLRVYDVLGRAVRESIIDREITTVASRTLDTAVNFTSAIDDDGDFVVVWQGDDSGGSDTDPVEPTKSISGQLFANDGSMIGGEFQVNTYTTSYQVRPAVAVDPAGNFDFNTLGLGTFEISVTATDNAAVELLLRAQGHTMCYGADIKLIIDPQAGAVVAAEDPPGVTPRRPSWR